jgi:hypothetical protein
MQTGNDSSDSAMQADDSGLLPTREAQSSGNGGSGSAMQANDAGLLPTCEAQSSGNGGSGSAMQANDAGLLPTREAQSNVSFQMSQFDHLPNAEKNSQRFVHLITWSQADDHRLPGNDEGEDPRQAFGDLVESLFESLNRKESQQRVVHQWVCSKESHADGGYHYHIAVKLNRRCRWVTIADMLRNNYDIYVNFKFHSMSHYTAAFKYVTKADKTYCTSVGHAKMIPMPPKRMPGIASPATGNQTETHLSRPTGAKRSRTGDDQPVPATGEEATIDDQAASQADEANTQESTSSISRRKVGRLNAVQVTQIIVENEIEDDMHLCALAKRLMINDQAELANWVAGHPAEKYRNDVIATSWKMERAQAVIERMDKTRIQKLEECLEMEHATDLVRDLSCRGRWLNAAVDLLKNNDIAITEWQRIVLACLKYGRNKGNNIFLVGERNMGKSFLLRPLTLIYDTFCNPASGSFNWVDAPDKEVILLNDFRYPFQDKGADKILPWSDFLNLLDVDKLNVAAPKTFFSTNKEWTALQPIFGNGPSEIEYRVNGINVEQETRMMQVRWRYVKLKYTIPDEKLDTTIIPCARCFAHLLLNGSDLVEDED